MSTEEDVKASVDEPVPPEALEHDASLEARGPSASLETSGDEPQAEEKEAFAPTQLGSQRFVYAAYFAGGIAIAFLLSKAMGYAWLRLATFKPQIGEPHDEIVMPIAGVIGLVVAIYYYRDQKTRTLAEEVASELAR